MLPIDIQPRKQIARTTGIALLSLIALGIVKAMTVSQGIDVNLNADIAGTAAAMMEAETALRAKAYLSILGFGLDLLVSLGLFLLLARSGLLTAGWTLLAGLTAALLSLLGGVFTMNAALLASNSGFTELGTEAERTLLTGLQAASDYTSFHLGLILSSIAMAGFFWLFLKSKNIPQPLAAFGLFATLFVAFTISFRDFAPMLGGSIVTAAFMLCNLIALVSLGLYLTIWGVRD